MKATKFFAAAVVLVAAGSAFAADAPVANAAVTAAAATAAANNATADKLNLPTVTIRGAQSADRAAVKAEAIAFVANHKTALAIQLEQYKN